MGRELSETEPGSGGFLEGSPENSACWDFWGRALVSGCENFWGVPWPSDCGNFLRCKLTLGSEDVLGRLLSLGSGGLESALNSDCCGLLGNTQSSGSEDVLVRSPDSSCRAFLGRLLS